MPPKAAKFRIRRGVHAAPPVAGPAASGTEDGFAALPPQPADKAAPDQPAEDIAAIQAEGLTGRQLRTARRIAQKHGIAASSDYEAVLLLRKKGIDPFDPATRHAATAIRNGLLPQVGDPQQAALMAHAVLDKQLQHQAGLLAYLDQFKLLAVAFLVLIPIVLLMRSRRAGHVELTVE